MAESAIDYVNLTRICEFTRALHRLHHGGRNDEVIEREFNAVCRGIWSYTLDDFTDDDLSPNDHAWLDGLNQQEAFDFAARHGYDLRDYVHGGWVSDWWGFAWMILAEVRGVLTPENRAAAWRKHDKKLMAQTNVVGVIRGPEISTVSAPDPTSASATPSPRNSPTIPKAASTVPCVPPLPSVLPNDLPGAIKRLDDQELDRLLAAVVFEQKRRGRKPPLRDEVARRRTVESVALALTPGKLNAVRAAFKAGVKPSQIARQFGISQADVRKALASNGAKAND
jgi:hypothetical protein